jgi:hypothetical protein
MTFYNYRTNRLWLCLLFRTIKDLSDDWQNQSFSQDSTGFSHRTVSDHRKPAANQKRACREDDQAGLPELVWRQGGGAAGKNSLNGIPAARSD